MYHSRAERPIGREAAQVHSVRKSLQPIEQLDHALQKAHGVQTVCLRPVRARFPAQSGPAPAQRNSAHRAEAHCHIVRGAQRPGGARAPLFECLLDELARPTSTTSTVYL
ncbi:hypothetical protein YQE_04048, partial [Dendroctonus ponderosae]